MADLSLKTVTRTQGNNQALKDGTVTPRNATLDFEEVPVLVQAFRRMVRELEFDVCEMAFTTYLCAKAHGKRFTALPIFLVRDFHHDAIVHNPAAGIDSPKDLEGRTVGVNRGYTVTTGVWARSILADEHGVDLDRVTWLPTDDEHVAEYRAPANVLPPAKGRDLVEMVAGGELPAAVGVKKVDHPKVETLVPEPAEAGFEALRRRGFYPINHLVVVKDELLDAHPDLAGDVFDAFARSKELYLQRLREDRIEEPTAFDRMHKRVMDLTGDPLPYGIEPNLGTIEQLIDHAVRQGILEERPAVESLFAEGTRDLTA
jgi:4,5-dihydroxyphthalate decarboxylase